MRYIEDMKKATPAEFDKEEAEWRVHLNTGSHSAGTRMPHVVAGLFRI